MTQPCLARLTFDLETLGSPPGRRWEQVQAGLWGPGILPTPFPWGQLGALQGGVMHGEGV